MFPNKQWLGFIIIKEIMKKGDTFYNFTSLSRRARKSLATLLNTNDVCVKWGYACASF